MKTLSVSAIKNGTVIDHIPAGKALKLIEILKLDTLHQQMTVGVFLKSKKLKHKDLIKIEGEHLPDFVIEGIAVIAPNASINFIENYEVKEKTKALLPDILHGLLKCPNPKCITKYEPVKTRFHTEAFGKDVLLRCDFCEKSFKQEECSI